MGGTYKIMFVNPLYDPTNKKSVQIYTTGLIKDNDNTNRVRSYIVKYYYAVWGSNVAVTSTNYDADDIETTVSADVVKTVYTVTVLRQINGPSFTMASIVITD